MRRVFLSLSVFILAVDLGGCANANFAEGGRGGGGGGTQNSVSVAITNKFASQPAGGPAVTVNATVANDSANAGVSWSLSAGGVNCSPTCGTLTPSASPSFSAMYTPPGALPSAPNNAPTITAVSVSSPSKSDNFSFSIGFSAGSLSGNYTFLLRGFGPNSVPAAIVGTVDLDNNGNVTGGQVDMNAGGQVNSVIGPLTGAYQVDTSFNGVTRGTITFTNATLPGTSSNLALKCDISADGKRGQVIEFDTSEFKSAGTMEQQDAAAVNGTIPSAAFAFGLDSDSATGARVVEAGEFSLAAAGVTGGLVDLSQADNANPIYTAVAVAPGAATPPDATGRGMLTLTVGGNAMQYAYYIAGFGQLFLVEIDNGQTLGTAQAGVAHLQNPLTANSVNTTSVLQMTGIDNVFGTQTLAPAAIIGVLSITGGTNLNATFDGNDAGTVLTTHPVSGQVVSFDPTTGRGVLNVTQGATNGFLNTVVFYLFDTGSGFVVDGDPTSPNGTPANQQVTNKAYSGTLTPQTAGPFGDATFSGNLISISGAAPVAVIPDIVTAINLSGAQGTFSAIADVASLDSQIGNSPNRMFTEDYQLLDATLGHGSATLPPGYFAEFNLNQPAAATFYVIGTNEFVLIGTLSGSTSGVIYFNPD